MAMFNLFLPIRKHYWVLKEEILWKVQCFKEMLLHMLWTKRIV